MPIGVIKGSEEALSSKTGILDENEYVSLSARSKSTFAEQRHLVYQIFTLYQKKKREHRDYDSADRRVIQYLGCTSSLLSIAGAG